MTCRGIVGVYNGKVVLGHAVAAICYLKTDELLEYLEEMAEKIGAENVKQVTWYNFAGMSENLKLDEVLSKHTGKIINKLPSAMEAYVMVEYKKNKLVIHHLYLDMSHILKWCVNTF